MLFALALLICWAVAEAYVALQVADAIGALATVLLLIASWPIGSWALRAQGRAAWRRLGDAIASGRQPGKEVLDGGLVLVGGALLIIPGFIGDALGVLLLVGLTRAVARRALARRLRSRFVVGLTGFRRDPSRTYDVDSTATDIDQPQLRP
jgi:UPF0716 protein FxsA